MATYALAGGVTTVIGYGDRWKFAFTGTWAFGDKWYLDSSYQGSATKIGAGWVNAVGQANTCFTYKSRIFLGLGSQFNFSDNLAPTRYEDQDPGAGFIQYLSQLGGQDAVVAFGQLQGRLAVFARRSIQIWNTDADPTQFSLAQQLDNIGTVAPLSVQQLGDFDVLFLDDTGIRSLRTREVTLNAYVDDAGSQIDDFVVASLSGYTASQAAGIVDPFTKDYWLHINGTIYVLSRHQSAKISAWSTYLPTVGMYPATLTYSSGAVFFTNPSIIGRTYIWNPGPNDALVDGTGHLISTATTYVETGVAPHAQGTTGKPYTGSLSLVFTPQKFVILNGKIYCRTVELDLVSYGGGGSGTPVYDGTQVTFQLPWLDDKRPATFKQAISISYVITGNWGMFCSMDPKGGYPTVATWYNGSQTSPTSLQDSSYDIGKTDFSEHGTHFSMKGVSYNLSTTQPAEFSSFVLHYNMGEVE